MTSSSEKQNDILNQSHKCSDFIFYLLMFMTRGMYQADLVKFKSYNLKNDTDNKKEDEYSKFCQDGYDYIVHTRSKNQNRSNNKMLIRIDDTTMIMFKLLKQSVWCTHQ